MTMTPFSWLQEMRRITLVHLVSVDVFFNTGPHILLILVGSVFGMWLILRRPRPASVRRSFGSVQITHSQLGAFYLADYAPSPI